MPSSEHPLSGPPPRLPHAGRGIASAFAYLSLRAALFPEMSQLTLRFAGRYVLSRKLGEGAMGVVFAAYDERLERTVALKVLRSPTDERARTRLAREAKNLAQLSDPHVVQVHDTGEFEDEVYLAMEHVEGQTLAEWQRTPRSLAEVTDALLAAGRGLAAAHAKGIVHRDVKPGNILIGADARVRVADFGLAIAGPIEGPTEDGTRVEGAITGPGLTRSSSGTPAYMAPEQHADGELTPRADIFSYCVVFWEAVFRVLPFRGDANECREAILASRITPPETRPPGVPPRLEEVLRRGLAARPELRPATMDELLAALAEVLHPRRVGRWIAGGALCVGFGAALATVFAPSEARACQQAGSKIAAVWSPEAREALRTALAADATRGQALFRQVEAAAEELQTLSGSLCEAHRDAALSDPQYHRGQRCLDARREDLASLLTTLAASPDLTFVTADEIAAALGPSARCGEANYLAQDVEPPPPKDEAALGEVDAGRRAGEAALLRGNFEGAAARFADAAQQARVIGYPPATAAALVDLGRAQLRLRRARAAGESLHEARILADGSRDAHLAADASLLLLNASIAAHSIGDARWQERETWARLQQSGQEKGAPAGLLALARADLLVQELDPDAADAALREAEELLREAPPGLWQHNLPRIRSQIETLRGNPRAALSATTAARAALERLTGSAEHPLFLEDRGLQEALAGDPAAAETLEHARGVALRAFGEDAPQLASIDAALIRAAQDAKRGDEVLAIGARARRLLDLHRDEPTTFTARVDVALMVGGEHVRREDTRTALEVFRWGLAGLAEIDAPGLGRQITLLAAAAADSGRRLGELAAARADIEVALRHLPRGSFAGKAREAIYVRRIAAEIAAATGDAEAVIRHGEAALALSPDPSPRAQLIAVLAPALGCSERTLGLAREARQQFLVDEEAEDADLLRQWLAGCEKGSSREGVGE